MKEYISDVKQAKFPEEKHCYKMIEGEAEKLTELVQ
jgi:ketopantoate hydroxymethyltransferase